MKHLASTAFWEAYRNLPEHVRALADKNYSLLKEKVPLFYSSRKSDVSGPSVSARITAPWRSTSTKGCCGFGSARMLITMT
jgi:hypothetical protein